jgi:plastocyanin
MRDSVILGHAGAYESAETILSNLFEGYRRDTGEYESFCVPHGAAEVVGTVIVEV